MELNQEFFSFPAAIRMKLNLLYNSHFCGSSIWRLESKEASQLVSSWNKNVKLMFDLPWATHRWILEEITGSNLKIMLLSKFINFANAIKKSNKKAMKFLLSLVASDVRSITGSNFRSILINTGVGVKVVPGITKAVEIKKHTLFTVPEADQWKVPLLHSLLKVKSGELAISFDDDDLEDVDRDIPLDILSDICTS